MSPDDIEMGPPSRPAAYRVIMIFLLLSLFFLIAGQTTAVIDYELAVRLGLQENVTEITEFGVQVNRAFGASDTLIYIPLIIVSIVGLRAGKPWALITTAAVMAISSYWAVTVAFVFWFLPGVPGYIFVPGAVYWLLISLYIVIGLWGLWYLVFRGNRLLGLT